MTRDRALRRYYQVQLLETAVKDCEKQLEARQQELDKLETEIAELRATKKSLLFDMRKAAADDPQLELPMWDDVPASMKLEGLTLGR
jgi:septal ring factor EnvC (AmiA/AmiB activator)